MIELQNVTIQYTKDKIAINRLLLTVQDGESVAIIGANGAGKSTLLLSLVGVVPYCDGQILIDDMLVDKAHMNTILKKVGLVFQNPDDQLFMPRVYDDVAFGPRHYLKDPVEQEARINAAMDAMHISALKERSSHRLSGGEKRRVALASVLAMEPSVLLLDEPAAFLDPKGRRELMGTLEELSMTKMIATHDLSLAKATCERTILLKNGELVADGKSVDVLNNEDLLMESGL